MRAEQYAKLTEEQKARYIRQKNENAKKNRRLYSIELGVNSDGDIIEWLDGQVNRTDTVRRALREFIANHPDDRPGRTPLDKGWDR